MTNQEFVQTLQTTSSAIVRLFVKVWLYTSRAVGSLILILVIGVVVLLSLLDQPTTLGEKLSLTQEILEEGTDGQIAVLNLTGPIVSDADSAETSFSSSVISAHQTSRVLKHLANAEEVDAIVLRINSPGGAVVASDELYQTIDEVSHEKPVVAVLSDVAASGGYYIALGADEIVANRATVTGSIGVIAQFPEVSGLFSKLGVNMRSFTSGEYKDIGSPTKEISPQEAAIIQGVIDDSYQQFVSRIVESRQLTEEEVVKLADGRIYTGNQAVENGLIDGIGGLDEAIHRAAQASEISDPTVIEYSQQGFLDVLFGASAPKFEPLATIDELIPLQKSGVYYLMSL